MTGTARNAACEVHGQRVQRLFLHDLVAKHAQTTGAGEGFLHRLVGDVGDAAQRAAEGLAGLARDALGGLDLGVGGEVLAARGVAELHAVGGVIVDESCETLCQVVRGDEHRSEHDAERGIECLDRLDRGWRVAGEEQLVLRGPERQHAEAAQHRDIEDAVKARPRGVRVEANAGQVEGEANGLDALGFGEQLCIDQRRAQVCLVVSSERVGGGLVVADELDFLEQLSECATTTDSGVFAHCVVDRDQDLGRAREPQHDGLPEALSDLTEHVLRARAGGGDRDGTAIAPQRGDLMRAAELDAYEVDELTQWTDAADGKVLTDDASRAGFEN